METIADIVAEMRAKTAKSKDEAWYDAKKWAGLCNRIEAAHKRELEDAIAATVVAAAESALEVYEPHIQSEPVGNAAKMREALNRIKEMSIDYLLGVTVMKDPEVYLESCGNIAIAALSATLPKREESEVSDE